eukprot:TRINITY_DN67854_c0_g2_i2.p1 TRINITY_DN67854_c0_g2~~TRINITY_DN67854_c0_g2_i2.p1  ORF type:complete len:296 (-),score=15.81 TRINITY_DN67854_c0_g2_i2:477-1364(-)
MDKDLITSDDLLGTVELDLSSQVQIRCGGETGEQTGTTGEATPTRLVSVPVGVLQTLEVPIKSARTKTKDGTATLYLQLVYSTGPMPRTVNPAQAQADVEATIATACNQQDSETRVNTLIDALRAKNTELTNALMALQQTRQLLRDAQEENQRLQEGKPPKRPNKVRFSEELETGIEIDQDSPPDAPPRIQVEPPSSKEDVIALQKQLEEVKQSLAQKQADFCVASNQLQETRISAQLLKDELEKLCKLRHKHCSNGERPAMLKRWGWASPALLLPPNAPLCNCPFHSAGYGMMR